MFRPLRAFLGLVAHHPATTVLVLFLVALIALGGTIAGFAGWSEYHFQAAQKAFAARDLTGAEQHIRHCLWAQPRSGLVHLWAGRIARRAGRFQEAEQHFSACQRTLYTTEELELERAMSLAQQGETRSLEGYVADKLQHQGDRNSLESIRPHPQAGCILEALALGYLQQYRFARAVDCFSTLLEWQPDNAFASYQRGWVRERQENLEGAASDYRHTLELDPGHRDAHLSLGQVLLDLTQAGEALPHFERVLEVEPEDLDALLGKARCLVALGRSEESLKILDAVLRNHPDHAGALRERGRLAMSLEGPDQAEAWLRKAVQKDPFHRQGCLLFYQCLKQARKEEEARWALDKLNQIDADTKRLGVIINRELAINPANADLHYEGAVIFLRNGMEDTALHWFYNALRIDPAHQPTRQALADHFEKAGRPDVAENYRQSAAGPFTAPDFKPPRALFPSMP
jgi:tetratricopeptide (TPR) repeat protein